MRGTTRARHAPALMPAVMPQATATMMQRMMVTLSVIQATSSNVLIICTFSVPLCLPLMSTWMAENFHLRDLLFWWKALSRDFFFSRLSRSLSPMPVLPHVVLNS